MLNIELLLPLATSMTYEGRPIHSLRIFTHPNRDGHRIDSTCRIHNFRNGHMIDWGTRTDIAADYFTFA